MQDIGISGAEVGLLLSSSWHYEGMKQEKQAVLKTKVICSYVWWGNSCNLGLWIWIPDFRYGRLCHRATSAHNLISRVSHP